jgi:ABC-2 type transport system permease protein
MSLGICGALVWAAFKAEFQYRFNMALMVLFGLVYQGTGFAFIWVVLSRFPSLGGWTLGEIAFLYGLRQLAHALSRLPSEGMLYVDAAVRGGEFDRFLVRPFSPLVQVMTMPSRFRIAAVGDLLAGILIFFAATRLAPVTWSPLSVIFLILAVIGGALVETALQLGITSFSFRLLSTRSLLFFADSIFNDFGNYPARIFGDITKWLLTAFPVAFVAYLPATVILGRTSELYVPPWLAYTSPLAGVVLIAAAYLLWRRELGNYQSTGN